MSDWLSKVGAKKKREQTAHQRFSRKLHKELDKKRAYEKHSYENNKDKIERTYKAIENYVSRAAPMDFNVTALRTTEESLTIEPRNHSPKGYPEINLEPYGNRLKVIFRAPKRHEERLISLNRISDRIIGEWVKYVADYYNNGYSILKRSKYFAIAVFVLGLFLLPYANEVAGWFGIIVMLFAIGFITYKTSRTYI